MQASPDVTEWSKKVLTGKQDVGPLEEDVEPSSMRGWNPMPHFKSLEKVG